MPPEPWRAFLTALDAGMDRPADLHCIGGFAMLVAFESTRATVDIDVLAVIAPSLPDVLAPALRGGALHQHFGVYLDLVIVVTPPENYENRLTEHFAGAFEKVRIWIPEIHDLALCKIGCNVQRDRDDVLWLAGQPGFDPEILRQRYECELRSLLIGRAESHDLTVDLWLKMIAEARRTP